MKKLKDNLQEELLIALLNEIKGKRKLSSDFIAKNIDNEYITKNINKIFVAAVKGSNFDWVKLAIENEADVNCYIDTPVTGTGLIVDEFDSEYDNDLPIPAIIVAAQKDIRIFELIYKNGGDINSQDEYGNTLLHHEILKEERNIIMNEDIMKYLPDIDIKNDDGESPISMMPEIEDIYKKYESESIKKSTKEYLGTKKHKQKQNKRL